ncbi:MAG: hypothetical protein JEZ07_01310 [Phycisphaerae bacterium]|nr:hypothetical protein [Phycisphaerae bacterium]
MYKKLLVALILVLFSAIGLAETLDIDVEYISYADNKPVSFKCQVDSNIRPSVQAVGFNHGGTLLGAGSYGHVVVWDLKKASLAKRIGVGDIQGAVQCLAFSNDGKWIAIGDGVASQSGAVRIFDVNSKEQLFCFSQPGDIVYSLALTKDGKFVAAGSADGNVYVWDIAGKKLVQKFDKHSGMVMSVAFDSTGKFMISGSTDKTVCLYDVEKWEYLKNIKLDASVNGICFANKDKVILAIVGGSENAIKTINTNNYKVSKTIKVASEPLSMVYIEKMGRLLVGCADGNVMAYNAWNGSFLKKLDGHDRYCYGIVASADGEKVASSGADGLVKVYRSYNGVKIATLADLDFRDNQWLIVTARGHYSCSDGVQLKWLDFKGEPMPEKMVQRLKDSAIAAQVFVVQNNNKATQKNKNNKPTKKK